MGNNNDEKLTNRKANNFGSWAPTRCGHWRQKVSVGNGYVTCSALLDHKYGEPIEKDGIDLGIYCDTQWIKMVGDMTAINFKVRGLYSAIFIPWADRGVIDVKLLRRVVNISSKFVEQGKTVDIGCLGGHGRTGTFLACLIAKVEKVSAGIAIREVHKRYCSRAIETESQKNLIYRFCFQKPPAPKYVKTFYGKPEKEIIMKEEQDNVFEGVFQEANCSRWKDAGFLHGGY